MVIDELIKMATLEKNGAAKEAYRAIKAELLLNASSKNPKPEGKIVGKAVFAPGIDNFDEAMRSNNTLTIEITELDFQILKKLIKQREESASIYDANSRKELADIERKQIKYLKELLPPEISRERIEEFVVTSYPNGFSKKQMGTVIKEVKDVYPTADGKLISEIVKSHITE